VESGCLNCLSTQFPARMDRIRSGSGRYIGPLRMRCDRSLGPTKRHPMERNTFQVFWRVVTESPSLRGRNRLRSRRGSSRMETEFLAGNRCHNTPGYRGNVQYRRGHGSRCRYLGVKAMVVSQNPKVERTETANSTVLAAHRPSIDGQGINYGW
jgi:hypothetical protein